MLPTLTMPYASVANRRVCHPILTSGSRRGPAALQRHVAERRSETFATTHGRGVGCRAFLADVLGPGKKERLDVINRFYGTISRQVMEEVLADDFKMGEEGHSRVFSKSDYIGLTADRVLPAIPDFNWGHACNGTADRDGFAIVTIMANGHHTGAPLELPGLPPLPPSGRHFCLAEEVQRVKVVGSKIKEIQVLPTKGAGPLALYAALGGSLPSAPAAAAASSAASVPPLP